MNKDDIKQLLLRGERITLECKEAQRTIPKSVWESYSAFANTIGGMILLGVKEDLKETDTARRFVITGVEDSRKMKKEFWDTLNSNKVNANILMDADVDVIQVDGKEIIYINVPQADWRVKPVFLNENVYKGTYKRNHEGDYHCTESEIKAMIRDANEDGNDGAMLEGYTMDDVDLNTLHGYRVQFRTLNVDHVWNDVDDKTFLKNLAGYTIDRNTGREGLTVAGLLMFGKGLSISERFANFRMDYLDMTHLVGEERYSDRLTYDGRWENNLYQFFRIVMPKLTFDLPRPFKMEGIQRQDDTLQHKAVREAFTNAIIHSDVFVSGGILRIEKHDDCLVLRNPGTLKLPIAKIIEGGNSKARNPRMQNMLRMVGYGENIGSGFPKILSAWQKAGWNVPLLENKLDVQEVQLTMYIPKAHEQENEQENEQEEKYVDLTERQLVILNLIKDNPAISLEQMTKKAKVSMSTIRRDIKAMCHIVKRIGGDKGGHWEIIK